MDKQPATPNVESSAFLLRMLAFIFVLGAAVFLPTLYYPFVYDDIPILVDHPVTNGQAPWYRFWESAYWPQITRADPLYRPLTLLSLRLDHELWRGDTRGFRLTAMILHGCVSALTAWLAWVTFHRLSLAWLAGLLFALHPIHSEVLGMVVGRSELLCALFVVLQLAAHVRFVQGDWTPRWGHHLFIAVMFFLGLCSKEHGAFAAAAIAAIDVAYRDRMPVESIANRFRRLMASHYLGLFYALALFLILRWNIYGWFSANAAAEISPFANPMVSASMAEKLLTPFALFWLTCALWSWPPLLVPVWSLGGFDLPSTILRWDVLAGVLVGSIGVLLALIGLIRRKSYGWIAASAVFFLLLPTHAIPAANWLFAERWLYVPSILLATASVVPLVRFPKAAIGLSILLGVGLFLKTWEYQRSWRDTGTIFATTLRAHPTSYQGLIGMCGSLCKLGRFDEIDPFVDVALEKYPSSPQTWFFHSIRLGAEGDPQKVLAAIEQFRKLTGWHEVPPELTRLEQAVHERMKKVAPAPAPAPAPAQ